MKLALCVTLVGLALIWIGQLAIPIAAVRPTQFRLQQYWVSYRLVNIGFTAEQATEAIRGLDTERLGKLAGSLGVNSPSVEFITVLGGLLAFGMLGLILLL